MTVEVAAATPARRRDVRHAALSSLYFGLSLTWLPIPLVLLPGRLAELVPHDRLGTAIGLANSTGAFFAVTVPPLVGAWSDRLRTPWGRRRPVIAAGVGLGLVGLALMATATNATQLVLGFLWMQIFLNGAAAAYYAAIPESVPAGEFGRASGYLAVMTQTGAVAGFGLTAGLAGLHAIRLSYVVMGLALVATVIPALWAAGEEAPTPRRKQPLPALAAVAEFFRPMWSGDFGWVVFTRMMVVAGVGAVAYFLSPFFRDVVHVGDTDQFTSIWLGLVFIAGTPIGLVGGMLSDRLGRKRFVYMSGAVQIAVAAVFIALYPSQIWLVLALGVAYGVGYGLYYAVDWALACDTLPDRDHAAKDMGLFHVAQTLPNAVVPLFEGVLIDAFNRQGGYSGYRVAFASVIFFFVLGTIFVSRIRSVR